MSKPRTIIRIGQQTLTFALPENNEVLTGSRRNMKVMFEPYTVKSGMSMAANLREAFRESSILAIPNDRTHVLTDSPVMMIPIEDYDESILKDMYHYTFLGRNHEAVLSHIMPDLGSVAVFSINKDIRMVINDHFDNVRITPLTAHVWQHLQQRSHVGQMRKMYAFFHEGMLSVASFAKNRFRFVNTFNIRETADAAYYILYVWQQLAMEQRKDELYIVGDYHAEEELKVELKKYLQNVFHINPSAEFNRAPITQIPNVTYDLICLCES